MKVKMAIFLLLCMASMQGCQEVLGVFSAIGERFTYDDVHFYECIDGMHMFGVCSGNNGSEIAQFIRNKLPIHYKEASGSVREKMAIAVQLIDNHRYVKVRKMCGSTAILACVESNKAKIHIFNIGDSRAIVEKNGTVNFATRDQTPDRPDEKDRIEKLGGNIRFSHGAWRVEDCLPTSRAIGDWYTKEYTIADPEYTEKELTPESKFLILATRGLCSLVDNQEAITLLCKNYEYNKNLIHNAYFLGNLAMERGNKDNITVMVVDLLLLGSSGNT